MAQARVVLRWWSDRGRALAIYAALFATLFGVLAFRTGQFQQIHRVLMGLFGLFAAYFAIVRVVNSTQLDVEGESLVVRHGPLPWYGGLRVALTQVDRVAVDAASRLQLTTAQGEEIALVDDVQRPAANRLNKEISVLLQREEDARG